MVKKSPKEPPSGPKSALTRASPPGIEVRSPYHRNLDQSKSGPPIPRESLSPGVPTPAEKPERPKAGRLRGALGGAMLNIGRPAAAIYKTIQSEASATDAATRIQELVNILEQLPAEEVQAGLAALVDKITEAKPAMSERDATAFERLIAPEPIDEEQLVPHTEPTSKILGVAAVSLLKRRPEELVNALHSGVIGSDVHRRRGEKLFRKFGKKFKETICGADGPYRSIKTGKGRVAIQAGIVSAMVCVIPGGLVWAVPFLGYVAALILKTGLAVYCEAETPGTSGSS